MSPEEARALLLPLHGGFGVITLIGGFGALIAKKGSVSHIRLGRLFAGGMALTILAAIPVLLTTGNLFLTGMGSFAGYLTWTGWRIARAKHAAGSTGDLGVSVTMILLGLIFAAYGGLALSRGHSLGGVALAMGLGASAVGRRHWRWFRAPPATRAPWVAEHIGAIGGGLIAGLTAFVAAVGTNYLPQVPEPIYWLGPVVVLGPLLHCASARYRRASPTAP
jgi:hypothetical protein